MLFWEKLNDQQTVRNARIRTQRERRIRQSEQKATSSKQVRSAKRARNSDNDEDQKGEFRKIDSMTNQIGKQKPNPRKRLIRTCTEENDEKSTRQTQSTPAKRLRISNDADADDQKLNSRREMLTKTRTRKNETLNWPKPIDPNAVKS
jgi:hypothetical protein